MKSEFLLIFIYVFGLAGCASSTLKSACPKQLPRFREEIFAASQNFGPSFEAPQNRMIASQADADEAREKNKDHWLDWAEDQMKEAQHYCDLADELTSNRRIRGEMNDLITELVMFHGYVQNDKIESSRKSLARIRALTDQAIEETCNLPTK